MAETVALSRERTASGASSWTIPFTGFDPSPERAAAAAARMQARLKDSLHYIVSQIADELEVRLSDFANAFASLDRGPVPPQLFGAYCDLVLALESGERERALGLLREIAGTVNLSGGMRIVDLADPASDLHAERYCRLVDTDVTAPIVIAPPSAPAAARIRALIRDAFALMDAGNPMLAQEIRGLLREIVLVGPGDKDDFDGVSSFMLWGSVVLNVSSYKSVLEMAQALAHESGHNLLFGLCADGPLHANNDEDRFPSPLRTDMRPIDGVVHATYVTARMHQAVQRLIEANVLDEAQRAEAAAANDANAKFYFGGMETVTAYAALTPLGDAVMGDAERYMRAFRP